MHPECQKGSGSAARPAPPHTGRESSQSPCANDSGLKACKASGTSADRQARRTCLGRADEDCLPRDPLASCSGSCTKRAKLWVSPCL